MQTLMRARSLSRRIEAPLPPSCAMIRQQLRCREHEFPSDRSEHEVLDTDTFEGPTEG